MLYFNCSFSGFPAQICHWLSPSDWQRKKGCFTTEKQHKGRHQNLNKNNTVFTCVWCIPVYNTHPYFGLHLKGRPKTEKVVTQSWRKKICINLKKKKASWSSLQKCQSMPRQSMKWSVLPMDSFSSQPVCYICPGHHIANNKQFLAITVFIHL